MKKKARFPFARLLLSLILLTAFTPFAPSPAQAGAPVGTIAYVLPNQPDGDEIHLIEPDGSGGRLLYRTNNPIPENLSDILSLAWKPDASELAFTGAQECTCSLYSTDIYTIRPDGSNYRRVTAGPACGARAGLPTGTVTVPVFNDSNTMGPFVIYFEGAPAAQSFVLAPGDTMEVTFYNVADYGAQEQYAVWMYSDVRSPYPGAKVDVVPGAAVRTGTLNIVYGFKHWGFRWPTYLPDGSKIATIFNEKDLYEFDPGGQAHLWWDAPIPFDFKLWGSGLAWGPTPATKDYFLYFGGVNDSQYGVRSSVFLGDVNTGQGQELFDVDPNRVGNFLLGLAWLPDGSGFLFSLKQSMMMEDYYWFEGANLWEYSFATGEFTRLTDVSQGFIRQMSVSPDGSQIVFEYQATGDWIDANPSIDLYMMNRDGSDINLFVEGARSPAWSPVPIPQLNPVPALAGINPTSAQAGGPGLSLTVTGSQFVTSSVVRWNGVNLPTTYQNSTTLTAQVTAAQIASPGLMSVTVFNPSPGGGVSQTGTVTITNIGGTSSIYLPFAIR